MRKYQQIKTFSKIMKRKAKTGEVVELSLEDIHNAHMQPIANVDRAEEEGPIMEDH